MTSSMSGVLAGIRVLDFSSMLPGPLTTLFLADAGAEVIKIEHPEGGEAGRGDAPVFAILNRGKRSIAIDLKQERERLTALIESSDILIEQFRPGVMDRLGIGYDAVRAINPKIIYVSINGYGSDGPDRLKPGHDITYSAEAGLLGLNAAADGTPVVPSALAADIAGGSFGALANILLALYRREKTGEGARLEAAMFAGAVMFMVEPLAHAFGGRIEPKPAYSAATGGEPRYNIYRTADGRHLACAPAEEKFWRNFCEVTGLSLDADVAAVAARMLERTAEEWLAAFEGIDVCCSLVRTVPEAFASDAVQRLFDRRVMFGTVDMPALPSIIDRAFLAEPRVAAPPGLGEGNDLLDQV